ncbi:hypothetical protein F4823DRAFT_221732 [Ustulina deusta]|nr:hypothetical protein F4823DRAFT_221732 [Ustulina deusta]
MPTPFLCRQCAARLARSSFRLSRLNKSPLHTQVIPAERPAHAVVLPIRHRGWNAESSPSRHPSVLPEGDGGESPSALLPSLDPPPQGQDRETNDITVCYEGKVWKFIPRRTATVKRLASLPLANNGREFKAKVLAARGDYVLFREDLVALYGLSRQEARHAVGQLERLLWGRWDMEVAARRLDEYLAWKQDFAAALQNVVSPSSVQEDNPSTSDAISEATSHEEELAPMRTAWQRLDGDRRERLWPQIVLSMAASEPHRLPTLIQSTFDPSWCPSYVVEDLIYLLCRRRQLALQRGAHSEGDQVQQEIKAIAILVLDKSPPRYLALEQTVLLSILSPLSTFELIRRFELLKTLEHPFHANTLLHVASRLAKAHDTKVYAVDILRILTGMPGFDLNSPAAASVCTSLLTLDENEPLPDQQAAPDLLFEFLIKQGFSPNLLGLSALMRNFCIRGHLDTAWKIFHLMLQHGLQPDHHVYSILLNGSKRNLDSTSLDHIFHIITSRNAWSPVLVNDFLDLLFRENESQVEQRRRQRKKVNNAWRPMLELYAKFYDLAPLQKFTLFSLENLVGTSVKPKYSTSSTRLAESLMPQPDNRLMQPDSITLCLMIGAHMRSLATPKYAVRYYFVFSNLVNRKDPTALGLLAHHGTLVFDIFLRTLLQFQETIGFSINQVRKKIHAATMEKRRLGYNLHHHTPSVHTWTILLNGLKNHNDTSGVVAIFDMITNIDSVRQTLPTWNALIQAFARTRNASGVVKAIWSLEKAGFQPDDSTIKAFNMLPSPLKRQAIAQLEEIRKAPDKFSNAKVPRWDSVTKPGASNVEGTQQFSSNEPIRALRPVTTKTLKALAKPRGTLDVPMIDARGKRRRIKKHSRVNSSLPIRNLTGPTVHFLKV